MQDGVVLRGDVGYLGRGLWQIKDGRCWQGLEDGGRLPEVRRVVVLGVEEQGELGQTRWDVTGSTGYKP